MNKIDALIKQIYKRTQWAKIQNARADGYINPDMYWLCEDIENILCDNITNNKKLIQYLIDYINSKDINDVIYFRFTVETETYNNISCYSDFNTYLYDMKNKSIKQYLSALEKTGYIVKLEKKHAIYVIKNKIDNNLTTKQIQNKNNRKILLRKNKISDLLND